MQKGDILLWRSIILAFFLSITSVSGSLMESSSYKIFPGILNSGGENSSSANYQIYTAFGETVVGNCSSNSFRVYLGFFAHGIDTDIPNITWLKPLYDNSTLVAKWFKQNVTVTDENLYWLNCTIYNSSNYTWWSKEWNLTYYTTYTAADFIDISSWPLGLYYENCTILDLTALSSPPSKNQINSQIVEFEVLPVRNFSKNLFSGISPNETKNWSLISSPLSLINESVYSFVSPLGNNWSIVFTYKSENDPDIALPGGSGDLKDIYFNKSYWIHMKENDTLEIEGINYSDSIKNRSIEIPLNIGWNIIGYPYTYARNVTEVLSGIEGKWNILSKFYNPPHSGIITWAQISPDMDIVFWRLQNFTQFHPGFGYEIRANNSCNPCALTYNFTRIP